MNDEIINFVYMTLILHDFLLFCAYLFYSTFKNDKKN